MVASGRPVTCHPPKRGVTSRGMESFRDSTVHSSSVLSTTRSTLVVSAGTLAEVQHAFGVVVSRHGVGVFVEQRRDVGLCRGP